MTWFKVDDNWPHHPKVRAAGLDGRALWCTVGPMIAKARTDGIADPLMLKDAAHIADLTPARARKALAQLVMVGLWHEPDHHCPKCPPVTDGILFHDWNDYQPVKAELDNPAARSKAARGKRLLRDSTLCGLIQERDRGLCRYCAVRVNWNDRKGKTGGTYDHVDPEGDNTLENVVVTCRRCNGIKRDRTPEEAGMVLLPPPDARPISSAQTWPASAPNLAADLTGSSPGPSPVRSDQALTRETGRVRSGLDSGQVRDLTGSDAGRGSGPGLSSVGEAS